MESDHGILGQFQAMQNLPQGMPQTATIATVGYEDFNKGSVGTGGVGLGKGGAG